ncbi:hypothetical protein EJ04DRAFT_514749 [Polyplosphaeria fusca]|uniref:F-box domain-containing protein n=1 Tax=Polyplosphaeria fusca TaxID=682080 RepID=A0A9P4QUG3_9PLEO|nr:hypothetical protein EJ04DRAFT_514749 [Polyplosphaeria fusca]
MSSRLETLTPELQLMVLAYITSKDGMKALSRSCKTLCTLVLPLIYAHIEINVRHRRQTTRFLESVRCQEKDERYKLKHTRSLTMVSEPCACRPEPGHLFHVETAPLSCPRQALIPASSTRMPSCKAH